MVLRLLNYFFNWHITLNSWICKMADHYVIIWLFDLFHAKKCLDWESI